MTAAAAKRTNSSLSLITNETKLVNESKKNYQSAFKSFYNNGEDETDSAEISVEIDKNNSNINEFCNSKLSQNHSNFNLKNPISHSNNLNSHSNNSNSTNYQFKKSIKKNLNNEILNKMQKSTKIKMQLKESKRKKVLKNFKKSKRKIQQQVTNNLG